MGLSGTGKSTLAAALAEATDFVWLRSDVIRKHDDATKPAPAAAERYGAAARAAVYVTVAREADAALAAGRGVIADATFIRRADRARLAEVAARTSADVSDARWDTYVAQRNVYEPCAADEAVMVVATDGPPAAVSAAALRRLWAWHRADG
jgi:predicted kinase